MLRGGMLTAGLLWGAVASAAVEGPGRNQFLHAARAEGPVKVDGPHCWRKRVVGLNMCFMSPA
jgi:hypothetical protein